MSEQDWQPIETAPKDGTNVLLWWPFWCKGRPTIGWFGYQGIQQWVAPEALEGDGDPPTHWMPLPASPGAMEHTCHDMQPHFAGPCLACAAEKQGDSLRQRLCEIAAQAEADARQACSLYPQFHPMSFHCWTAQQVLELAVKLRSLSQASSEAAK